VVTSSKKTAKTTRLELRKPAHHAVLNTPAKPALAPRLLAGVAAVPFTFAFAHQAKAATVSVTDLSNATGGYTSGYTISGSDVLQNTISVGSSYSQILGGAGSLSVILGGEGSGAWNVGAENTFTGTTYIGTGATVNAGVNDIFSHSSAVTINGTLNTDYNSQLLNDLGGSGSVSIGTSCGGATLTVNIVNGSTWSGNISDSGGEGAGNLVVTSDNAENGIIFSSSNTYSGTTDIQEDAYVTAAHVDIIDYSSDVNVDGTLNMDSYSQGLANLTGHGTVITGSSGTIITMGLSHDASWYGSITGAGSLELVNTGEEQHTWLIGGTNSYTGSTDIQDSVQVYAGAADVIASSSSVEIDGTFYTGSYDQTLNNVGGEGHLYIGDGSSNGTTLTVNITEDSVWAGDIANHGTGGDLTVTGSESAAWYLTTSNSYIGSTDIQEGAVVVAEHEDVIANSESVNIDGIFVVDGDYEQNLNDLGGEGNIYLGNSSVGGDLVLHIVGGSTWNGNISDGIYSSGGAPGNVTIVNGGEGSNILTLGGENTYTGTTDIQTGANVEASTSYVIGDSSAVNIDGSFDANGYNQQLHNLSGEGTYTMGGEGSSTLIMVQSQDAEWDGDIIGDSDSSLVVALDGDSDPYTASWSLTEAQDNFYGNLDIQSGTSVSTTVIDAISNASEVNIDGHFNNVGFDQTLNNLNGSGNIYLGPDGSTGSTLTVNLTHYDPEGYTPVWSGVISDAGAAGNLIVTANGGEGSGAWYVSNANTYTGTTDIQNGAEVAAEHEDVFATSSAVNVDGLFILDGYDQTLRDLSGSGEIYLSGSGSNSTLNIDTVTSSTWDGVISDGSAEAGGNVNFISTSSYGGHITLGAENTYTGATDIDDNATVSAAVEDVIADSIGVNIDGTLITHEFSQTLNDLGGEGQVLLGGCCGGSTLTMNIVNGSDWDGVISDYYGQGSVIVTNGGEGEYWNLSNQNTYTGTTYIESGAHVRAYAEDVIAESIGVAINGEFDANGYDQTFNDLGGEGLISLGTSCGGSTLTLNIVNGSTWEGDITDGGAVAGNLVITLGGEGSSSLNLYGNNTYTGTTDLQEGTEVVAYDENVFDNSSAINIDGLFDTNSYDQTLNNLSGDGEIYMGGSSIGSTLTLHTTSNTAWNGVISDNGGEGAGNVVFTSSTSGVTITLGDENTYTGTTEITEDTVVKAAHNDVFADSIGVTIDGTFDADGYDQLINDLTGSGLIEMGEGDLTLNGIHDTEFSGVLGGEGAINFTGEFVTRLTGISTNTSAATVEEGTLKLDGTLNNDSLTIDEGATLKGNGTLNGDLINDGTVAPGSSPGTLNIGGNYSGSGTLEQELTGDNTSGNFDLLIIGGTADLSGTTVDYTPLAPAPALKYTRGTQYTFLTAAGGLGGTEFVNAAEDSILTRENSASIDGSVAPGLAIRTNYTGTEVIATIVRTQLFGLNGRTYNQTTTGNALDNLQLTNTDSDMEDIINEVDDLDADDQPYALDALSGSINAELITAAHDLQHRFDGMVGKRLGGDCNKMGDQKSAGKFARGSAWACAYGDLGQIDADGNTSGVDSTLVGFATGYEFKPTEASTVRVGIGYGHDYLKQDTINSNATLNSYQIGAYGQQNLSGVGNGGLYVGGGIAGAYNTGDTERNINFGGIDRQAKGDPDGYTASARAVLGYEAKAGNLTIEPVAALDYVYSYQQSFTETGADAANLRVDSKGSNSLRGSLGAQASSKITLSNGMSFTPEGRAAFIYDALQGDHDIDQSFASTGAGFNVRGAKPGRAGLQGGAGITLNVREDLAVFADYTGTVKNNSTNNSVMGGLKYSW